MQEDSPLEISSRINREFLREIQWVVRLSLREINDGAGLGDNYIYKLLNEKNDMNPTLATLDKLHNFLMRRFWELKIDPPDDLWMSMIIREVR